MIAAMTAKKKESPSMLRQRWLETVLVDLRPYFAKAGYGIPDKVRVSVGWAKGNAEKTLGQCWHVDASSDKHHEIFTSPKLTKSEDIIGVIIHELVHATVGVKCKHRGDFKTAALALGLEGKMTSTTMGPLAQEFAEKFVKKHGKYPAGALNDSKLPKQSTRLIKCTCEGCGYIARVTRKWIDEVGAPYCGTKSHGRMDTDYEPEEGGDE